MSEKHLATPVYLDEREVDVSRRIDKRFFRPDQRMHGNVVLNFVGHPKSEFNVYGSAFRRAGRALANSMASRRGYNDLDGLPIIFLYRHSCELYAKAIVRRGRNLFSLHGQKLSVPRDALKRHELRPLLKPIRDILEYLGWEWQTEIAGLEKFADLEAFIQEIDSFGDAWRYPVDNDDEELVSRHLVFNVIDVAQKVETVIGLLDGVFESLEEKWNEEASIAYPKQEAERVRPVSRVTVVDRNVQS